MFENIVQYLYIIPCALIAIVFHELAHGLMSYILGDSTPKEMGRLTLNPLKHIDIVGILCLIFFGFGWAKPVMINPNNYKNKKLGMTLVALAGPLMNILIALLSFFFIAIIFLLRNTLSITLLNILLNFFKVLSVINLGLGIFNLIPLPPLDGSKIIGIVLPEKAYEEYMGYQKYGMFFMLGLVIILNVLSYFGVESFVSVVTNKIYYFFIELIQKIVF